MKFRQRKKKKRFDPKEAFAIPEEVQLLEEARTDAAQARKNRIALCREDVNEFAIFIGKRLNKGKPWKQEELHEFFQEQANLHPFAIFMSHPESGKTTQLAVIRTVWELGNNPDLRFAIISYNADSKGTAAKVANAIRELIEKSPEVAEVFPDLVPGPKWEEKIFTVRRPTFSKDPSVQVVGYKGGITGSRIDRLICDDLIVLQNTSTPDEREKFNKWFSTILDRLTEDARSIFMCNAWHPRDYVHTEEKKIKNGEVSAWTIVKVPVHDKNGNFSCSFWNAERLEKVRPKFSPIELARIFFCRARDDGEAVFDQASVERAFAITHGIRFVPRLRPEDIGKYGLVPCCGVDLAVTQKKGSHRTSFSIGVKWPEDGLRQLLWIYSGRFRPDQIADLFVDFNERYASPIFIVENNAAQRWIMDIVETKIQKDYWELKGRGIEPTPVEIPTMIPFTTGRNKAHPEHGIQGLAADVAANRWVFPSHDGPCRDSALRLREGMEFFTPGVHPPDELMSTWFLREGLRRGIKAGRRENEGADFERQIQVYGPADDEVTESRITDDFNEMR